MPAAVTVIFVVLAIFVVLGWGAWILLSIGVGLAEQDSNLWEEYESPELTAKYRELFGQEKAEEPPPRKQRLLRIMETVSVLGFWPLFLGTIVVGTGLLLFFVRVME